MPTAELKGPAFRPGLGLKLFFAASILLLIPLLGFLYVRELEHLLLKVQEQGVVATARAVGTALNDRPSLFLSGEVYPFALAQGNDLRIDNLPSPIAIDGQSEDWTRQPVTPHWVGAAAGNPESRAFSARYRIGRHGNALFALFEVTDARVVLRDPDREPLPAADHLEIAVVTPDDEFLRFAIDARGTGKASVYLMDADGEPISDPRIQAVFRLIPGGYLVELRLPRSLVGPRLGFMVVDSGDPESATPPRSIGTSDILSASGLGAVIVPSPEVSNWCAGSDARVPASGCSTSIAASSRRPAHCVPLRKSKPRRTIRSRASGKPRQTHWCDRYCASRCRSPTRISRI